MISAVLRIRADSALQLTNAQLHAALVAEGADVEVSAVKKAASKAAKRTAATTDGSMAITPAETPAAVSKPSNKELKAAKASADAFKAVEGTMMKAVRRLQNRHLLSSASASGDGSAPLDKASIDRAVTRAISGALDAGETVSRERFEADVATLQWVLHPMCPRETSAEQAVAAAAQLEMLMAKRS